MTQQGNEIRQKINRCGYKLKVNGNQYYIKGLPGGKSFKTLEEVEKWADEKIAEKKREEDEYRKKIEEISKTVIFPVYSEKCKEIFFESIREHGISDSLERLEKIFDENSELYEEFFTFDLFGILSFINERNDYSCNLGHETESDTAEFYYNEIKRLNPNIEEDDICELVGYDTLKFWSSILEHITIEELKKFVFDLKKK
jgi:hypothetical protein